MLNMYSRTGGKLLGRGRMFRRRGGSVLELALTLSILFSICYGLIEFGYYFYIKNTMEGAVREGCRAGIVTGATMSTCNSAIENQLQAAGLVANNASISGSGGTYTIGSNYSITYYDTPSGSVTETAIADLTSSSIPVGDTLTVKIQATWSVVGQGFRPAGIIGASKVLSTASSMRKEG